MLVFTSSRGAGVGGLITDDEKELRRLWRMSPTPVHYSCHTQALHKIQCLMFRNLLSPLRARFELPNSPRSRFHVLPTSPRSPRSLGGLSRSGSGYFEDALDQEDDNNNNDDDDDDDGLEDFARGVMVELMTSAVESLKTADEARTKTEVRRVPCPWRTI